MPLAKLRRFIPMVSFGGAVLVGVCCLRIPVLLSMLAAIGLGFLTKGVYLLSLMVAFLAAMLIGLLFDYGFIGADGRWGWLLPVPSACFSSLSRSGSRSLLILRSRA